jgi:hypothetical protein
MKKTNLLTVLVLVVLVLSGCGSNLTFGTYLEDTETDGDAETDTEGLEGDVTESGDVTEFNENENEQESDLADGQETENSDQTDNPENSDVTENTDESEYLPCGDDSDCDDGNPCNGIETCWNDGFCRAGELLDCDDGIACTGDVCDPVFGCIRVLQDDRCADGDFCNGTEICDITLGCVAGTDPCDDGDILTTDICDPTSDTCEHQPASMWTDTESGLTWMRYPDSGMTPQEAIDFCYNLNYGTTVGVWRLPTIDELRSLVSGCPNTEPEGSCPITNECNARYECGYSVESCSCPAFQGPTDGCYMPEELEGGCQTRYLSSTPVSDVSGFVWSLNHTDSAIGWVSLSNSGLVRCVKDTVPE